MDMMYKGYVTAELILHDGVHVGICGQRPLKNPKHVANFKIGIHLSGFTYGNTRNGVREIIKDKIIHYINDKYNNEIISLMITNERSAYRIQVTEIDWDLEPSVCIGIDSEEVTLLE